jgi:catechol 2,3-dioxygenase-like lactoylglutathione lyase family enzyme
VSVTEAAAKEGVGPRAGGTGDDAVDRTATDLPPPALVRRMRVTGIDHLVLYATDVDRTCEFYAGTLGVARVEEFGGGRVALSFGETKLNVHPAGDEYEPHAAAPTPGAADFCLVVDEPVEALAERFADADVPLVDGPVARTGARGGMRSVYVRDPDGNLVEFAHYDD